MWAHIQQQGEISSFLPKKKKYISAKIKVVNYNACECACEMQREPCIPARDPGEDSQNSKRHAQWISHVTYRRGELVTRQWCGWDLCTTHRERKRKEEQNKGDRKKEWKSEMNDGGTYFFFQPWRLRWGVEVGGAKRGGDEVAAQRAANAWSSWPKHLQVPSVGREGNRNPLADWLNWRSSQQQQRQWQQHTQRGFLASQVFMQDENLVKKKPKKQNTWFCLSTSWNTNVRLLQGSLKNMLLSTKRLKKTQTQEPDPWLMDHTVTQTTPDKKGHMTRDWDIGILCCCGLSPTPRLKAPT